MTTAVRPETDGPAPAPKADRERAEPRRGLRLDGVGNALAWAFVALLALATVAPGLLAGQDPNAVDPLNALAGPDTGHILGTDQLGRDVYSRIVHGTRQSILIGLGTTLLAVGAGSLLGVLAAAGGRIADQAVMRVTDILLAFPGLLLALLVVAILGPGSGQATIAIGVAATPGFIRLARGQALAIRESDYIRAAVVLGRPRRSVYIRHLLPNAIPPVLVLATVSIGTAVIAGSSLSFLGLGPPATTPEWGSMLADGRDHLDTTWTLAVFPGVAVTATVIAITIVGRGLRHRFEGRTAHVGR